MTAISDVIGGDESTLFNRVHKELVRSGCDEQTINDYERHQNDDEDTLIDISMDFLNKVGCW